MKMSVKYEDSKVDFIDNNFNDLMVVNAARISFAKWHDEFDSEKDENLIKYLIQHNHWSPFAHPMMTFLFHKAEVSVWYELFVLNKDLAAGFHVYELKNEHYDHICILGSLWAWLQLMNFVHIPDVHLVIEEHCPVSYANFRDLKFKDRGNKDICYGSPSIIHNPDYTPVTFRINAPTFVARQLQKHCNGFAWNEVSRRYVRSDVSFLRVPANGWREQSPDNKQCSLPATTVDFKPLYTGVPYSNIANNVYQNALRNGVCGEQARMVLPLSTMTQWMWTAPLYCFKRVFSQRIDGHAQIETQRVVQDMKALLAVRGLV